MRNETQTSDMLIQSQQVTLTGTEREVRRVLAIMRLAASFEDVTVTLTPTSVPDAAVGVTQDSQQNPRQPSRLDAAVVQGKALGKKALYFGCWDRSGHFLHDANGRHIYSENKPADLPWDEGLMDGGLLKNGKIPDLPDGRVFWTAGGLAFWYAFYWWDRSVDTRGACNSGFYVRGFGANEEESAFQYACEQFPHVVKRQKYPLVLQTKKPQAEQSQQKSRQDGEA